jgi:formate dehydrogenase maturation protein FdhE
VTEIKHDYPACAIFRGGKCTCDEADNLCPRCGSEEWDRITDRTAPGASFNRCNRCENEWAPVDSPTANIPFEPCGKCRNHERCERGCVDHAANEPAPMPTGGADSTRGGEQ